MLDIFITHGSVRFLIKNVSLKIESCISDFQFFFLMNLEMSLTFDTKHFLNITACLFSGKLTR